MRDRDMEGFLLGGEGTGGKGRERRQRWKVSAQRIKDVLRELTSYEAETW